MNMSFVYLATPYSHPDPKIREERFNVVNRIAAKLMAHGVYVFSPISHTHPIALAGDLPKGWDYWEAYDRAILSTCGRMIVVMQQGWESSVGVQAEMEIATELGIPIDYMEPLQ